MKYFLLTLMAVQSLSYASVDPEFYNRDLIEMNGHLWRPIMLYHHPKCPCQLEDWADGDEDFEDSD